MASINEGKNYSEEDHQSRIAKISRTVKRIAFKKQETTKTFQKGDDVEVASQEYGFIGSYYKATITSSIDNNKYWVKYTSLLTDDESAPLKGVVTASELRPLPPEQYETMSEKEFFLYDMVDVFANDGWWFGIISGIIGQEYYVYFPTTTDNIAYPSNVLRFHQEWLNEKWILL
ncbi:protein AGENET DOMAIN (AGD)-CONTAINING P1-like [Capsicum galapagoense]